MKKFITLIIGFLLSQICQAQDSLVSLKISSKIVNNKTVVNIAAKAKTGYSIFSIKDATHSTPLASTIIFDSALLSKIKLPIAEVGTIITQASEAKPDSLHLLQDTVVWQQSFDTIITTVAGKLNYMLLKGDEFVQGNISFLEKTNTSVPETDTISEIDKESSWSIFWLCFWVGIGAIFTPCVFPLIPVTVSFFLKKSKTKAEGVSISLWYSISIVLIYTIPTLILVYLFGDKILYQISTHWSTNLLFFAIFILFGISLLGGFELQLPSSWANAIDKKSGRDFKGIFFMALTLVVVSFSCTGPIVGAVLGSTAKSGNVLKPILGMMGFGIGLALPFSLFAFFPNLIKNLPKSGGWLNVVKVCFGFVELALALKFLSNVDLIFHWGILDRDVFLALWIALAVLTGLYLLGKLKFSHDSDAPYISIPKLFFAIASLSFAVYLVPGMWGAPLQPLSGIIPPATTQDFNLEELKYKTSNFNASNSNTTRALPPKKLVGTLKVPFGLTAYFDLEEGMAAAKILNKPVMLDFTGHSCANCRKMEEEVWKNSEVLNRIKENFVLISLYVDESTTLPLEEQYTNAKGDKIKTVGDKNLDYEINKFGLNAQPLYMFLDTKGNVLSDVKYGYDPDIQKFISHLDKVKAKFEEK
jgi:thiol:disulfide interchange protein DsbD